MLKNDLFDKLSVLICCQLTQQLINYDQLDVYKNLVKFQIRHINNKIIGSDFDCKIQII